MKTKKRESQRRSKEEQQQQEAKKSFEVRRSNLMTIAGRGNQKKKKGRGQKSHGGKGVSSGQDSASSDGCNSHKSSSTMLCRLVFALKQFISCVIYFISFGYFHSSSNDIDDEPYSSSNKQRVSTKTNTVSKIQPLTSSQTTSSSSSTTTSNNYYDEVTVVGLDCEMVGGGRGGYKSLLARCSVVTLDMNQDDAEEKDAYDTTTTTTKTIPISTTQAKIQKLTSLNDNLVVLYDKFVIPKGGIGKITDYRSEWSGITKDTYKQQSSNSNNNSSSSSIPIVSFNTCQNEITQLFSSINGKKVIVVGHALENDFDVLEIEHPLSLIRDTAFYKPYMRKVRRKMYSNKLSTLSSDILDIEIQNNNKKKQSSSSSSELTNDSNVGHSSVEDAAAALRLYWHQANEWERSLGYPFSKDTQQQQQSQYWPPVKMYLDGCNLPIGIRGVNMNDLLMENKSDSAALNGTSTIPTETFRLTSRRKDNNNPSNVSTIDWIPSFQNALSSNSIPKLECISVMFDGAKFNKGSGGVSTNTKCSFSTRAFVLDSSNKGRRGPIKIEITESGESADDVLFHRCCTTTNSSSSTSTRIISLNQVIEIFSNRIDDGNNDALQNYVVIRRKAGGSKTHRRLFDKLHLRRPNEGALCLSGLTHGLQKNSLRIARELQRERSVERVIECELRNRDELRDVVVTDDVYLTDRLVKNGVLVLSYKQLTFMW